MRGSSRMNFHIAPSPSKTLQWHAWLPGVLWKSSTQKRRQSRNSNLKGNVYKTLHVLEETSKSLQMRHLMTVKRHKPTNPIFTNRCLPIVRWRICIPHLKDPINLCVQVMNLDSCFGCPVEKYPPKAFIVTTSNNSSSVASMGIWMLCLWFPFYGQFTKVKGASKIFPSMNYVFLCFCLVSFEMPQPPRAWQAHVEHAK